MTAGREIERKWVLREPPREIEARPGTELRQRYLAVDADVHVRLRRAGDRRLLTIKSGTGLDRAEEEMVLDPAPFDRLWALAAAREVAKRRHDVPLGDGLRAQVDVYAGRLSGLVSAEVEFTSDDQATAFTPPAWLGTEVTGDARYGNVALASADGPPDPAGPPPGV